jgi:hypothetical protein
MQHSSLSGVSRAERGVRQRVWNEVEALLIEVEEGIK